MTAEISEESSNESIRPGDFYEDCAYHPCVCIGASDEDDDVWGISLIDGTYPRSCSPRHCDVVKLTVEQVWEWKTKGPPAIRDDPSYPSEWRWWSSDAPPRWENSPETGGA